MAAWHAIAHRLPFARCRSTATSWKTAGWPSSSVEQQDRNQKFKVLKVVGFEMLWVRLQVLKSNSCDSRATWFPSAPSLKLFWQGRDLGDGCWTQGSPGQRLDRYRLAWLECLMRVGLQCCSWVKRYMLVNFVHHTKCCLQIVITLL